MTCLPRVTRPAGARQQTAATRIWATVSRPPPVSPPAPTAARSPAYPGQREEPQPVAQRPRRVVVRLHLHEAEAAVQRQRLGLADAGIEIHARVRLLAPRSR